MSKMLSNQKIINEIKASQIDYVKTRPEMIFKPFVNNRSERDYNLGDGGKRQEHKRDLIGGYKSLGQHPRFSNSVNGNTAYPDPLFGGAVKGAMYNNYLAFNNRGGALLGERMPLEGGIKADCDFYSESDSDSDSEDSSSEDEDEDESESDSDYESEEEDIDTDMKGGGIYDDYIKPAGKALLNTGKAVFKDIVVPVGKEILKDTIKGVLMGAGKKGGLSGTKKEFIHILKAMHPNVDFSKKKKKELMEEIKKSIPTTDFIPPLQTTEPKKRGRPKSDKPKAEAKPRGRPKGEPKEPKEPKKKGRPSKVKKTDEPKTDYDDPNKHLNDLENIFNEVLDTPSLGIDPNNKKLKRQKKPKLDITPEPTKKTKATKAPKQIKPKNRLTKDKFMKETNKDLFFSMLKPDEKQKAYEEYKTISPMLEASFLKKYFETNYNNIADKLFKKEGAGIKKIVGTKTGERVRGDVVAEVMKKQGLSLGQASKYVSEHNLY